MKTGLFATNIHHVGITANAGTCCEAQNDEYLTLLNAYSLIGLLPNQTCVFAHDSSFISKRAKRGNTHGSALYTTEV